MTTQPDATQADDHYFASAAADAIELERVHTLEAVHVHVEYLSQDPL